MTKNYCEYIYLRPKQLKEAIQKCPIAYIPFGALEWHGPHNPLGTDGLKAELLLRKTAEKTGGVMFPCEYWGAFNTMKFAFSFEYSERRLGKLAKETVKQLYKMGFRVIILFIGHGPLKKPLKKATDYISRKHKDCYAISVAPAMFAADLGFFGDHAASWETSFMLELFPDLVDLELAPKNLSYIERLTQYGIWGFDPTTQASSEKGKELVTKFVTGLSEVIDEVFEKKSQIPFQNVYDNYSNMRKTKRLNSIEGALKYVGMDEKQDIPRLLRWMYLERKKARVNFEHDYYNKRAD
ncbi:MAG: creatininase family protein [archaeon]|nr:creatininase family protein [archaeon]